MKTTLHVAALALGAVLLGGCATTATMPSTSSASASLSAPTMGSIAVDDLVATATIHRLEQAGQYRTVITIERVDADGQRSVIAAPRVISRAGQSASIEVAGETGDLAIEVTIPEAQRLADGANVTMRIRENGRMLASPQMRLPMPG